MTVQDGCKQAFWDVTRWHRRVRGSNYFGVVPRWVSEGLHGRRNILYFLYFLLIFSTPLFGVPGMVSCYPPRPFPLHGARLDFVLRLRSSRSTPYACRRHCLAPALFLPISAYSYAPTFSSPSLRRKLPVFRHHHQDGGPTGSLLCQIRTRPRPDFTALHAGILRSPTRGIRR